MGPIEKILPSINQYSEFWAAHTMPFKVLQITNMEFFFSFIQSSLKTNLYTSRGSIYLKTIHNIKSSYFLISQHRRTYFLKSSQNTEQETVYHPSSEYNPIRQTIHKSITVYWHSTAFGNPTFRVTQISKRMGGKITAA